MAMSGATMLSPTERAWAGISGDLMQRFLEMWDKPPPPAGRLLRWTLCAGRDPKWVAANAKDLRRMEKAGLAVTQEEFDTWKHSIQNEMTRPSELGESMSDWYDRLRRLHGFEFPSYPEQPYWRWHHEAVKELTHEGKGALVSGLSGSGKTAVGVLICEELDRLKRDQVLYGNRSILGQMEHRRKGNGGTPDSEPDKDPSHLGLWYARGIRFVSNGSVFDDPRTKVPSPIADRWKRHNRLSGFFLELAKAEREGDFCCCLIDEAGIVADKFSQGSSRVKSIVSMTRIIRGMTASMVWMTQYGQKDLPEEIRSASETIWELEPPKGGHAQGIATISVPGSSLRNTRVSRVPLPISGFDTKDKPVLDADISVALLLQDIGVAREKAEGEEKKLWGREERAAAIEAAVGRQLRFVGDDGRDLA